MDPLLNGLHIAILVTNGFEGERFSEAKSALEREGAITKIVSEKHGTVQGADGDTTAGQFEADLTFEEIDPKDFDAVVLPGGTADLDRVRNIPKAQDFIRHAEDEGKPVINSDKSGDIAGFTRNMVDVIAGKMQAGLRGTADEHATGIASS
jgi:protease I